MKLLHTMIRVKDVKKSLDFYTKLFDMELAKEKRLDDCTLYFLSDKEGYTQIELTFNDETPKNGYELGNGFGHFAFETESMANFGKKLKEMGLVYLYEPYKLSAIGSTIAFIKDPDGYEIEIIEKSV